VRKEKNSILTGIIVEESTEFTLGELSGNPVTQTVTRE
jgi:hypothetical protein